ncbi:DUF6596 domain-containing protein [Piscinibacter sakaiensis]|uniref:Putative RNA polymerase sigma factor n=1 Tax=Piscinibacter sakaiensis TaxID=1547922 RepID=A0A0K8NY78_PISS1|nr:DUF6596 domain-containing protein [Piscinibacter sakaiensis]GAP35362.1 putative RNA polymerase sigma factor [Piscinibacter sakaiensis]
MIVDAALRRRLVAHLAHALGLPQLGLVEDAVQVACLRALETWPAAGRPEHPAGWLYRVAWRQAIDQLRREQPQRPLPEAPEDDAAAPVALPAALQVPAAEGRFAGELDDEELALLFAACHPAVPPASQVALALRAACALDLHRIAEGLLTSEAALQQRLARARAALRGVSLAVPAGAALGPRREAVLATLMLMFQAGWRAGGRSGGPAVTDVSDVATASGDTGAIDSSAPAGAAGAAESAEPAEPADAIDPARVNARAAGPHGRPGGGLALAWEAIRLARALAAHPAVAHPDADALAALLLLHGARLSGRFDAAGDIVPLAGQDRDRWDAPMRRMGLAHLQAAMRATRLSRWHLLAGIAAEHALAPDWAGTDWGAILRYYDQLVAIDPSAAPRLGQAVALAEGGAPAEARDRLLALLADTPPALRPHALAALARAHERLGEPAAACSRLREALPLARSGAEARLLARRLQALEARAEVTGAAGPEVTGPAGAERTDPRGATDRPDSHGTGGPPED